MAKAWRTDTNAWVVVEIRNVGSGVAVIENGDEGASLRDLPGSAPGDRAYVVFATDSSKCAAENTVHSFVSVGYFLHLCLRYADVGGQNVFESVFEIGGERPDPEVNLVYRNAASKIQTNDFNPG